MKCMEFLVSLPRSYYLFPLNRAGGRNVIDHAIDAHDIVDNTGVLINSEARPLEADHTQFVSLDP